MMTPEERAKIPHKFRGVPVHYNHSRLDHINKLARKAGIDKDVHQDVRELPPDNGERFFSEYLKQQKARNATLPEHPETDRCQCNMCATKPIENPYRTRSNERMLKTPDAPLKASSVECEAKDDDDTMECIILPQPEVAVAAHPVLNLGHSLVYEQMKILASTHARLQYQQSMLANMAGPAIMPPPPLQSAAPPPPPLQTAVLRHTPKPQVEPHCCTSFLKYCLQKYDLFNPSRGRPPHDKDCPYRG
jgi:hypothetical protein